MSKHSNVIKSVSVLWISGLPAIQMNIQRRRYNPFVLGTPRNQLDNLPSISTMKNQYFGDVNDYQKYGLLRTLIYGGQYKIGVCWMLTADDGRTDGKFTSFLNQPQVWRKYDPQLFDLLYKSVVSDRSRNVALAQNTNMLPGAEFYSELLTDSRNHRTKYFNEMKEKFSNCRLIFFDPDNGIEIKSAAKGRRNSAKYVYWDELNETYESGHSILLYQHFRREERTSFVERTIMEFQAQLNPHKIYWFRTSQVVYFLCLQERDVDILAARVGSVAKQWGSKIQIG